MQGLENNDNGRKKLTLDDLLDIKAKIYDVCPVREKTESQETMEACMLGYSMSIILQKFKEMESGLVYCVINDILKIPPPLINPNKIYKNFNEGVNDKYTLMYDDVLLGEVKLIFQGYTAKIVFTR